MNPTRLATGEEIREIPGFAGYFASRSGGIYRHHGKGVHWNNGTWRVLHRRQTVANVRTEAEGLVAIRDARVAAGEDPEYREVRSHPVGKGRGHLSVMLGTKNGSKKLVHRLVALAWIPNPEGLPVVRHLNNDPSDNRVENLAWGTYRQNSSDWTTAYRAATTPRRSALLRAARLGVMNGI
jgi:hypothetical protein